MEQYRYVILAVAILFGVAGQLMLKTGAVAGDIKAQLFSFWTIGGLACYFLAALGYMMVLRTVPLSVAYPTVASSYVVVLVASHFLFGEALTVSGLAGIACIGFGIFLVHRA